jgi:tetratricopeptide (TPR) repeat protein
LSAEEQIYQLESGDLTQFLDHLTLCGEDKRLLRTLQSGTNELNSLIHGVWFLHKAWKTRGHKSAGEVSNKKAGLFLEQLQQSEQFLLKALTDKRLSAEVNSRLIRLYTSLGDTELAKKHFKAAIAADKMHLWSYIHYAELVQPKWGGSIEIISEFLKSLPEDFLIKNTVHLKLVYDSLSADQPYFEKDMDEMQIMSSELIEVLDKSKELNEIKSVQRFVLYGYIYSLSVFTGNKGIQKKYRKLIGNNYSLYPFGY